MSAPTYYRTAIEASRYFLYFAVPAGLITYFVRNKTQTRQELVDVSEN